MSLQLFKAFKKRNRSTKRNRREAARRLSLESLEIRTMLNADLPWHNSDMPADATNDGYVTTMDALTIVNELNNSGPHQLANPEGPVEKFLDN